ncbi:MAG: hypothetical protein ACYCXP_04420 [Leptospirillum sp.]
MREPDVGRCHREASGEPSIMNLSGKIGDVFCRFKAVLQAGDSNFRQVADVRALPEDASGYKVLLPVACPMIS